MRHVKHLQYWLDKIKNVFIKGCKNLWGSKCVPHVHDWLVLDLGWAKLHLGYLCESLAFRPECGVHTVHHVVQQFCWFSLHPYKPLRGSFNTVKSSCAHSSQQLFKTCFYSVAMCTFVLIDKSVFQFLSVHGVADRKKRLSLQLPLFQDFRWRDASFKISCHFL